MENKVHVPSSNGPHKEKVHKCKHLFMCVCLERECIFEIKTNTHKSQGQSSSV